MSNQNPNRKPPAPNPDGEKPSKNMAWLFIAIFAILIAFMIFQQNKDSQKIKKSLSHLNQDLDELKIKKIMLSSESVEWEDKDGKIYYAIIKTGNLDDFLLNKIYSNNLEYYHLLPNAMMQFFASPLPWLVLLSVIFFLFMLKQLRGGSGGVLSFGKSRAQEITPDKINKTFKDVAGIDEAKEEVYQIVDFLKDPHKYLEIGARIPRGVLLEGLPGTGKTLLAKAIAGEAGVPFFSISGSDFIEMFVGVGASRVRDLFQQARDKAPCIIFIDEIDAIGKNRGADPGGGERESHQTLNAILVEMDGFSSEDQVVILAATNRADVLDNALLRPGRFDRHVHVNLPDLKGREEILRVHSKPVKMAGDIHFDLLAKMTPGYSGADLENLINEAALIAVENGKHVVTMDELEDARDKTSFGKTRKSMVISEKTKRDTAYHEAGHAILSLLIPEANPLHKVTILPRGRSLGSTMFLPNDSQEDGVMTKKQILAQVCVAFGGRIAEDIFCDDISTGASQDIEQATTLVKKYVTQWGLSEELGPVNYISPPSYFQQNVRDCSQKVSEKIDYEIKMVIDECYKKAFDLINSYRTEMDQIANMLVKKEILSVEEICDATGIASPKKIKKATTDAKVNDSDKKPEQNNIKLNEEDNANEETKDSEEVKNQENKDD